MSAVSSSPPIHQQEVANEEQYSGLFCRALYDYEAQDASALSFRRDDIIEVLTQQPSGWWDGLLGIERGWFPSNYVVIISDEEAELAFSTTCYSTMDGQNSGIQLNSADISHSTVGGTQAENEEWLDNELSFRNGLQETPTRSGQTNQPSDFWMPEVTPDGQVGLISEWDKNILLIKIKIFYVNTQTGQRSRDLPQETDDEVSDGDLAGLTSQAPSRSGITSTLAFGAEASSNTEDVPLQNGAPEPWVKKVSDDGVSFYYLNTVDGRVQWAAPDKLGLSISSSSFLSNDSRQPDNSRLSVYSDDSDVQPFDNLPTSRPRPQNGKSRAVEALSSKSEPNKQALMELTASEQIAKALQHALEPPPPSLVTDLSAVAKGSIQAIIENLQSGGSVRHPEDDKRMDQLVNSAVLAVRNLLYVSAAPTSHIPNNLVPGGNRSAKTQSQTPLKPAQRKVTATLSRLVLSARAMQYDSGSQLPDTLNRIETDSEELEKAVLSFVLEVQRNQYNKSDQFTPKQLQGVFTTANIGMGLVGAGAAGSWKGYGFVSLDDNVGMPQKALGTEVVTEIGSSLDQLQTDFIALGQALRSTTDNSGQ